MTFAPYPPEDFDRFWHETYKLAAEASLDYQLGEAWEPTELGPGQMATGTMSQDHQVRQFEFRGVAGERLQGWIASPLDGADRYPSFLWLQPYGRESVLPNQYGTRPGFVSLSFNYFGETAFHREKYTPLRGYFAEGIEQTSTWKFRSMFQNAVIAGRVLQSLANVDGERIGSCGMSQGGGFSIWLGAWCPFIKAVCADMPFLGAMHETLLKGIYRYPLKELQDWANNSEDRQRQILRTISYFDTLNQGSRCDKPTLVSVGLKDPAVRPVQVESIYEVLPGKKRFVQYDWGHDWHPGMVVNNQNWLLENL